MNSSVGVLGGGSWGTALAKLLHENGNKVKVWIRDESQCQDINNTGINKKYLPNIEIPKGVLFTSDINEAVCDAEIILIVVPTQKIREVLRLIDKKYKQNKIVVNASKGIEIGTLNRISEIVYQETEKCTYVVLSGPSHAEEVALQLPTAVTAASEDEFCAKKIQDIFMSSYFRVYTNSDVIGAELGGALKNIIALGAGISDGVGYGDNAKAALINRGIVEISRLGVALRAKPDTFSGLSGIGDLIVTCTSKHSRNRNAGYLIGQGYTKDEAIQKIGMVVEGITTTYAAYDLAHKANIDMPIVQSMYDILEHDANVKDTVTKLMMRDKKDEKSV